MPSKKKDRRSQYTAVPNGQLMDAAWVLSALANNPQMLEAISREARLAGFEADMVENTRDYLLGITGFSRDADATRAELTERYIDTRTRDVIRDIVVYGSTTESEVRGLVKELSARLSPLEMRDEIEDMKAAG